MTRTRIAVALAVVAGLAVLATGVLALTTYVGEDPAAEPLVVADPGTGARLQVPGEGWVVRGPRSRIFYADDAGRTTATVAGPAVFRDGYCAESPGDSNRGFVGFTGQSFRAWRLSLSADAAREHRDPVVLGDGTPATLRWVRLPGGGAPCAAPSVELAMVASGDLRAVLVADAGEDGTLGHDEIVRVLTSIRP